MFYVDKENPKLKYNDDATVSYIEFTAYILF